MKGRDMNAKGKKISDELRPEYNFDYSKAVRGKYYKRILEEGANFDKNNTAPNKKIPRTGRCPPLISVVMIDGQRNAIIRHSSAVQQFTERKE
jgi:hypothetical protein